jgi:hypothetical protein
MTMKTIRYYTISEVRELLMRAISSDGTVVKSLKLSNETVCEVEIEEPPRIQSGGIQSGGNKFRTIDDK